MTNYSPCPTRLVSFDPLNAFDITHPPMQDDRHIQAQYEFFNMYFSPYLKSTSMLESVFHDLHSPTAKHWDIAKCVLQNLQGTHDYGLVFHLSSLLL